MKKNIFYVYIHMDPSTFEVRYVGKGHGERASSISHRKGHHRNWLKFLEKQGKKPRVTIIEDKLSEEQSLKREIFWIKSYKEKGCKLTNGTNGGEGVTGHKHSPESLKKMGAANKGKKLTVEHKAKISAANKGQKRSNEVKKILSNQKVGKKFSNEHKVKLSEAHKGKKQSLEHKAKIVAANTGKKRTAEQKAKWSKPVLCHETGITYPSAREAAKQLGLNEQVVYKALKSLVQFGGEYTFSYALPEKSN